MPLEESIVGLPGWKVEDIQGSAPVEIRVKSTLDPACPRCKSQELRIKARYTRRVRHENLGARRSYLVIEGRKFHCKSCGRYFREQFPGIGSWRRSSESFRRQIVWQHQQGISQRVLADKELLGSATVERWTHELLERKNREYDN